MVTTVSTNYHYNKASKTHRLRRFLRGSKPSPQNSLSFGPTWVFRDPLVLVLLGYKAFSLVCVIVGMMWTHSCIMGVKASQQNRCLIGRNYFLSAKLRRQSYHLEIRRNPGDIQTCIGVHGGHIFGNNRFVSYFLTAVKCQLGEFNRCVGTNYILSIALFRYIYIFVD